MQGFEENEISKNAFGGTELSKRAIAERIPSELSDKFQIIASRSRELNEDKIRVYWHHDLPEDPEVKNLISSTERDKYHKFVFVSNWQLNEFHNKLGFPLDGKTSVIENPIIPIELSEPKPTDRINLIYFSTPHRGLELLVPVFEELSQKYDNMHLDVFSSFEIYGWKKTDLVFETLFQKIKDHPNMTYHGFKPNDVVRAYLKNAHILAYPNVWKETSCRVLIESMSAGLMCVHPNYGALPETGAGLTSMYQFEQDPNAHAKKFYDYLEHAIKVVNTDTAQNYLKFVKTYADVRFNLDKISGQWYAMMEELEAQYKEKDLSIPKDVFVYNTN